MVTIIDHDLELAEPDREGGHVVAYVTDTADAVGLVEDLNRASTHDRYRVGTLDEMDLGRLLRASADLSEADLTRR